MIPPTRMIVTLAAGWFIVFGSSGGMIDGLDEITGRMVGDPGR